MKVAVQYFAVLREQSGVSSEEIETSAESFAGLYEELRLKHGFTLPVTAIKVAANAEFGRMEDRIADGCSVVFIPPVAGG